MHNRFIRHPGFVMAVAMSIAVGFITAGAQTRKQRSSRRVSKPVITNPTIVDPSATPSPSPAEDRIISTADEEQVEPAQEKEGVDSKAKKAKSTANPASDEKEIQETINELSNQVERLSDTLTQMQENDKALLDLERLTRAEQRAESLRQQLFDTEGKIADLESRIEQLDYALKPENIERATAAFGSLRPEEARDSRRRQLQVERSRAMAQLRILEQSKVRLEGALSTADAECELLRRRIETQREREDASTTSSGRAKKRPQEKP